MWVKGHAKRSVQTPATKFAVYEIRSIRASTRHTVAAVPR
jgi:hypothetical protein